MNKPTDKQIKDVLAGAATKEVASEVARWFSTDDGMDWIAKSIDEDIENIKPAEAELYINHAMRSDQMLASIMKQVRRKRMRQLLFRVAAVLVPFIFIIGLVHQIDTRIDLFGDAEMEEVIVPKGERIQVMFQDGTRAYINSDSRLKYPRRFGFSTREVYLEGEAYFVVTSNKQRPFVVNMDKTSIRVFGTSFNVEAYSENKDITIFLEEGKVSFNTFSKREYSMSPGEKLVYNKKTEKCAIYKNTNSEVVSSWKQNVIVFRDATLSEVTQKLSRWYDVTFKITDEKAWNIALFTLTSKSTTLPDILKDLEKISSLKFQYDKNLKEVLVAVR